MGELWSYLIMLVFAFGLGWWLGSRKVINSMAGVGKGRWQCPECHARMGAGVERWLHSDDCAGAQ